MFRLGELDARHGFSDRRVVHWPSDPATNEQGLTAIDDQRGREPCNPFTLEQEAEVRRRLGAGPTEQHAVCSLLDKDNVN